jgi:hypothetical protein
MARDGGSSPDGRSWAFLLEVDEHIPDGRGPFENTAGHAPDAKGLY